MNRMYVKAEKDLTMFSNTEIERIKNQLKNLLIPVYHKETKITNLIGAVEAFSVEVHDGILHYEMTADPKMQKLLEGIIEKDTLTVLEKDLEDHFTFDLIINNNPKFTGIHVDKVIMNPVE